QTVASLPMSPGSARTLHSVDARGMQTPSARQIAARPWLASTQARLDVQPACPSTQRPPGPQTQPAARQSVSRKQGALPAASVAGASPSWRRTCPIRSARAAASVSATAMTLPVRSDACGGGEGAGARAECRAADRDGTGSETGASGAGPPPPAMRVGALVPEAGPVVPAPARVAAPWGEKGASVSGMVPGNESAELDSASCVVAPAPARIVSATTGVLWPRSARE